METAIHWRCNSNNLIILIPHVMGNIVIVQIFGAVSSFGKDVSAEINCKSVQVDILISVQNNNNKLLQFQGMFLQGNIYIALSLQSPPSSNVPHQQLSVALFTVKLPVL